MPKFFLFDRNKVFIGSANFDLRSFRLNTEVGLIIESTELARQVAQRFEAISQPANSYQLELQRTATGEAKVTWHTMEGDNAVVRDQEPGDTFWRRMEVNLLSLLPLDEQL